MAEMINRRIDLSRIWIVLLVFCFGWNSARTQNSLLVNFGSSTCASSTQPAFHILHNPLTNHALNLANCDFKTQVPDFFSVFIAYNPSDNNIYIADNRTGAETKIWRLDMGLPGSIACPQNIPSTPDIRTNYVSNNFEFDNNGDLWSFSEYDRNTGTCKMDQFDLATQTVVQSKTLRFPEGNFPTAITSGDLCILPNGRLFATLGSFPSRLYEITNYAEPGGEATANFLSLVPQSCYGIAYVDGKLELTGTDLQNVCYYFLYDISTGSMSGMELFQNGLAPIDNSSITPALGATKKLLSATRQEGNSFFISYEIYIANMGNMVLNDIRIEEDLQKVFGAGNISEVAVSFAPGGNPAGLNLNAGYNGVTDLSLLQPGQQLKNKRNENQDYFAHLILSFRASNLNAGTVYRNSALVTALINNDVESILVVDSSNDGTREVIDPNRNGLANEPGENVPTPFSFGVLPVEFVNVQARSENTGNLIQWKIGVPAQNADFFEVEAMRGNGPWQSLGRISITNPQQADYQYRDLKIGNGEWCYRIKEVDKDGTSVYSTTACVSRSKPVSWKVMPNPFREDIIVTGEGIAGTKDTYELFDFSGRKIRQGSLSFGRNMISGRDLPAGSYHLVIRSGDKISTFRLSKL